MQPWTGSGLNLALGRRLKFIFCATATTRTGCQDAGIEQELDVAQRRIERAPGEFGIARGGQFRIGAVHERVDDEALAVADG